MGWAVDLVNLYGSWGLAVTGKLPDFISSGTFGPSRPVEVFKPDVL